MRVIFFIAFFLGYFSFWAASQNCLISYTLYLREDFAREVGFSMFTVIYYEEGSVRGEEKICQFSKMCETEWCHKDYPIDDLLFNRKYMGAHPYTLTPPDFIADMVENGWSLQVISPKKDCGEGKKIRFVRINNVNGKSHFLGKLRFRIEQKRMKKVEEYIRSIATERGYSAQL